MNAIAVDFQDEEVKTPVKECVGCGQIKPLSAFNKMGKRAGGVRLTAACGKCRNYRQAWQYLLFPEKIKSRNKSWFVNNPEKNKRRWRSYYLNNRPQILQRLYSYKLVNKDRVFLYHKKRAEQDKAHLTTRYIKCVIRGSKDKSPTPQRITSTRLSILSKRTRNFFQLTAAVNQLNQSI